MEAEMVVEKEEKNSEVMTEAEETESTKNDGNFERALFEIILSEGTSGNKALVKLGKLVSLKINSRLNKVMVRLSKSEEAEVYRITKEQIITNHIEQAKEKFLESIKDLKFTEEEKIKAIQKNQENIIREINIIGIKELNEFTREKINLPFEKPVINTKDIREYKYPENPSIETIKLYDELNFNYHDMFVLKDIIEFVTDDE